jgi:hypothetical protein
MIPIKSADRTGKEMQDLEALAAKLLETARKLPSEQDRHNALQEIERFRRGLLCNACRVWLSRRNLMTI